MTLRFKAPRFVKNAVSKYVSRCLSEDSEVDINFQINEMEIGIRNKRVYSHVSVDADINRKDLMKLIKNAYF